jgi:hypothetical protein
MYQVKEILLVKEIDNATVYKDFQELTYYKYQHV